MDHDKGPKCRVPPWTTPNATSEVVTLHFLESSFMLIIFVWQYYPITSNTTKPCKRRRSGNITTMPKTAAKTPAEKTSTTKNQLLGVIAQLDPFHNGKPPRDLVARRAGYGNAMNPSFKKALSRASKRNHLDLSDKSNVTLTASGLEEAGDAPDWLKSNDDAHTKIQEELTPAMRKVFELVKDGKRHSRSEIASSLEYPSVKHQGFKKLLDRIRLKGYLEFVDKEFIQLSDICFPAGRD